MEHPIEQVVDLKYYLAKVVYKLAEWDEELNEKYRQ